MKDGPHNKQLLRRPVPAATGQAHALPPCPSFHPGPRLRACVRRAQTLGAEVPRPGGQ